jgi:rod shape determining protein RodA
MAAVAGYGPSYRERSLFRGWDRFDYVMLLAALALVAYGIVLIYSGALQDYRGEMFSFASPVTRQIIFALVGIGAMLAFSRLDYHRLTHYAWALYGLSLLSLVAILAFGHTAYGSTRWFNAGPVQIQPSEFAKISAILLLARFFSERGGDARDTRALWYSLAIVLPCAALVFVQPDLGTTIAFMCIWLGVVLVAGVNRRHLLVLGAVGIALLPFIWTFGVAHYQVDRVSVLVNPYEDPLDSGYNVIQAQIAVGSGQLLGKGFTNGEQTQLRYLKVPTKDFIFSVASEEFGFVGGMGMFALFVLLLMRGVRVAQIAGDVSGQLIAVGIVILILVQAFINIAVNLSLFPVTGIPLPFVSQGGSSLVSMFVALGILQSIAMRHRSYRQA